MNIWTYWEGPRLPYIDLCLRSMQSVYGDGFQLVTPETLGEFVPDGTLHPNYNHLQQPALRADCVRAALLAIHGGWWFDADTIALASLDYASEHYASRYMIWDAMPVRVLNGYIALRKGCYVAERWLSQINQQLAMGDPDWCSLGEKLLTPLLCGSPNGLLVPRRRFLPIDIDSNVATFMQPGDPAQYIQPDTVCFGLNHSWMVYHHLKEMTRDPGEWRDSPLLIHKLLNYAQERYQ